MKHVVVVALVLAGALTGLAACGGGGGGGAPEVEFAAVTVTEPAQDLTVQLFPVQTVTIRFTDRNAAPGNVIDVVADLDGLPTTTDDQIVIRGGIQPQGGTEHEIPWKIGGVFNGDYVVYVRMQVGEDLFVYGRAPGRVRINGFPTFSVIGPRQFTTISRGGLLCYGYTVADPEDDPVVALTLDADGDHLTTEDAYPLPLPPNQVVCTYNDTPTVPPGGYRIVGTADDGVNGITARSAAFGIEVKDVSWGRSWGGAQSIGTNELLTLEDGSSIVAGTFRGPAVLGLGEPNETALTSNGGQDLYIARFDPDGKLVWARGWGGIGNDWISGMARHPSGGFVLTGAYTSAILFGPGESTATNLVAQTGGRDRFVARFGSGGGLVWAKNRDGGRAADEDHGGPVTVLGDGSIITWGGAQDRSVGPLSTMTSRLERLDANGDEVWTQSWSEYGQYWRPAFSQFRPLSDGGFLAAVRILGTITFGAGTANETTLTAGSTTRPDVALCKFDGNGALQWYRWIRGSTGDIGVNGIALFEDESFVVAGSFPNTATFGPGEAGATQRTSLGLFDGFVAWYAPDGTFRRVRTFGSPVGPANAYLGNGEDYGTDVAVLPNGSCIVHAQLSGNATLEDTGAPRVLPLGYLNRNVLCVRYDAQGAIEWLRTDAAPALTTLLGPGRLGALPDGSFVRTGFLQGLIVLGAGEGNPVPLQGPPPGAVHPFLSRVNADGRY